MKPQHRDANRARLNLDPVPTAATDPLVFMSLLRAEPWPPATSGRTRSGPAPASGWGPFLDERVYRGLYRSGNLTQNQTR